MLLGPNKLKSINGPWLISDWGYTKVFLPFNFSQIVLTFMKDIGIELKSSFYDGSVLSSAIILQFDIKR